MVPSSIRPLGNQPLSVDDYVEVYPLGQMLGEIIALGFAEGGVKKYCRLPPGRGDEAVLSAMLSRAGWQPFSSSMRSIRDASVVIIPASVLDLQQALAESKSISRQRWVGVAVILEDSSIEQIGNNHSPGDCDVLVPEAASNKNTPGICYLVSRSRPTSKAILWDVVCLRQAGWPLEMRLAELKFAVFSRARIEKTIASGGFNITHQQTLSKILVGPNAGATLFTLARNH
jgi:hypothetical protein